MSAILDFIKEIFKSRKKDSPIIVKNYNNIKGNNNQNITNNQNNKNKSTTTANKKQLSNNKIAIKNNPISIEKIRLYSTGAKGKVYTTKFYKSVNHNFGIEVVMRNNTSQMKTVKLGHCVYDERGKTLFTGTFYPKIKPNATLTENIFVDSKAFSKMKNGTYKSQFWINDKRVQKVYFNIYYK